MNNILNLYSIEFKRIYKLYLVLVGLLFIGNIGMVSITLNHAGMMVGASDGFKMSTLLKTPRAIEYLKNSGINDIHKFTSLFLGLAVVLCLIYGAVIWYRDFSGKSKSGYMLFMLPINKFNIYIAKAITVILMIYGLTISQIVFWIIDLNIIESLTKIEVQEMLNMFMSPVRVGLELRLIQYYFVDFIIINVIGVILAVIIVFTGVMIQKSYKSIGYIIGPLYVGLSIIGYIELIRRSIYSDEILMMHIVYYILLFSISIAISYRLINKKVYV